MAFLCPSLKIEKKVGQGHTQSDGHLVDILEAQIALAALNRPHKRSVNAAFVGKSLLRIALLRAQLSDSEAESPQKNLEMSLIHGQILSDLTLLRLHSLHRHSFNSILVSKGGSFGTRKEAHNEASDSPDWRWRRGRRLTAAPESMTKPIASQHSAMQVCYHTHAIFS